MPNPCTPVYQAPSCITSSTDARVTKALNVRVGCLNCRGIKTNTHYINILLKNLDFLALSEHWLHAYELHSLSNLHKDFVALAFSSPTKEDLLFCQTRYLRGHGGVALLWRKALNSFVTKLITHRICGARLRTSPRSTCIFSVYLPSRSGCTDDFKESLDMIDALINTYGTDNHLIFLGDFNADPGLSGGPYSTVTTASNEQGRILTRYLTNWDYVSVHLHCNSSDHPHTYVSEAHNSKSTIDHIITHRGNLDLFRNVSVLEDDSVNLSDHLPITCTLESAMESQASVSRGKPNPSLSTGRPNWSKLTKEDITNLYTDPLEERLSDFPLIDVSPCSTCSEAEEVIETYTASLTSALLTVAEDNVPVRKFRPYLKPQWNDELRKARKSSTKAWLTWRRAGKPFDKSHPIRMEYKSAKGKFRSELCHHLKDVHESFMDSLDSNNSNPKKLFDEVRHFFGTNKEQTNTLVVDGVTYDNDTILAGWAKYFKKLLSSLSDTEFGTIHKTNVEAALELIPDSSDSTPLKFSESDVMDVTKSLPKRKASGPDMIEGQHLIYAGDIFNKLLIALLNAILVTGYVPDFFRKGFTKPILKGPDKDLKNPGNYRGISLLSNLSKVLEKLILHRLNEIVSLNPLQGGFRHGLSSNHTAFILQEAISSFRRKKKKAYVAFLDAQKAFDSVWHSGLLVKLRDKGVPLHIWKVIKHWYISSFTAVLWDGHPSEFVPIDQGVRQGAILSPLLYSIYVDELLDTLAASGAGAHINSLYVGAPMFADDLALVADSPTSLQSLINLVHSYTIKWRYKINPAK